MSKSSKEAWTWEPQSDGIVRCFYCHGRITKKHSFGCSKMHGVCWHTECGGGPRG